MRTSPTMRPSEENSALLSQIDAAPKAPGVYKMLNAQRQILYIGKSVSLHSRVRSYFKTSAIAGDLMSPANALTRRIAFMTRLVHSIDFEVTPTATDALVLEASLVRLHQPPFNVLLKDDKRYPYVCITYSDVFPRVFLTRRGADTVRSTNARGRSSQGTMSGEEDLYIGPFVDGAKVRALVEVVKEIFPMQQRPSPLYKDKPCLNYHIGRCPGVCQGLISPDEYRRTIRDCQKVLEGNGDDVVADLEERMLDLAKEERFEEAAHLRDMSKKLADAVQGSSLHFSVTGSTFASTDTGDAVDVVGVALVPLTPAANAELEGSGLDTGEYQDAPGEVDAERTCVVQIIRVRSGRIASRVGFTHTVGGDDGLAVGALLQRVLEQYYQTCSSAPPRTVILPTVPLLPEMAMVGSIIEERLENDFAEAEDLAMEAVEGDGGARGRTRKGGNKPMTELVISMPRGPGDVHLCTYVEQLARREASVLMSEYVRRGEGLLQVAEMLGMGVTPSIIEGYDISHLSGANTVASRVVFVDGVPDKSRYRRYKLTSNAGSPDDYASMREVLAKRFLKRTKSDPLPDMVLIDGGRGQLSAAVSVLEGVGPGSGSDSGTYTTTTTTRDVGVVANGGPVLISLAKRHEEVFAIKDGEAVKVNDAYGEASPAMRLLRSVRDEAHNYAVNYQRSLRKTFF